MENSFGCLPSLPISYRVLAFPPSVVSNFVHFQSTHGSCSNEWFFISCLFLSFVSSSPRWHNLFMIVSNFVESLQNHVWLWMKLHNSLYIINHTILLVEKGEASTYVLYIMFPIGSYIQWCFHHFAIKWCIYHSWRVCQAVR